MRDTSAPSVHLRSDQAFEVSLPGGRGIGLTRRQFLYGAAGIAGAAVLCAGGVAVNQAIADANEARKVKTLSVKEDQVFSSEDCTQIEDASSVMTMTVSKELPYGSLVWCNDDAFAACLMPTDNVKPLNQVGLLSLESGNLTTVVSEAISQDEGYEIYDVRANSHGLIWTESRILEGMWRVYSAAIDGSGTVGRPQLVLEGDRQWEMPSLAAVGSYAWWQKIPRSDGEQRDQPSTLNRASFGSTDAQEVYSSDGRMSTAIYALQDAVVITPRVDATGTYYQLTHIDADSGQVTDTLVLPASMTPLEAGYGKNGFHFSFDAIYNYGGGIANLGTYTPATPVTGTADANESTEIYSQPEWFRFARNPSAPPAWCDSWFVVKSTSSVCGVDLENRRYFALGVETGADDYGDYLATSGMQDRIVTYSNIDYTPIGGETKRYSLVRVWELGGSPNESASDDSDADDSNSDESQQESSV